MPKMVALATHGCLKHDRTFRHDATLIDAAAHLLTRMHAGQAPQGNLDPDHEETYKIVAKAIARVREVESVTQAEVAETIRICLRGMNIVSLWIGAPTMLIDDAHKADLHVTHAFFHELGLIAGRLSREKANGNKSIQYEI